MQSEGPGEWYEFTPSNIEAAEYQQFINGKPLGWDFVLKGTLNRFDGWLHGKLLEAKYGYERLIQKSTGTFYYFIEEEFMHIARTTRTVLGGRYKVQWHFSNQEVARAARELFKRRGFGDIIEVHYTPWTP